MLEILLIVWLSKKIGIKAQDKGYSRGMFRALSIVAWVTGEIAGALLIILFSDEVSLAVYLFALLGAGAGMLLVFIIVLSLPEKEVPAAVSTLGKQWVCGGCGYHNTSWDTVCHRCKAPKSMAADPTV
jgi:hypothetical protein